MEEDLPTSFRKRQERVEDGIAVACVLGVHRFQQGCDRVEARMGQYYGRIDGDGQKDENCRRDEQGAITEVPEQRQEQAEQRV